MTLLLWAAIILGLFYFLFFVLPGAIGPSDTCHPAPLLPYTVEGAHRVTQLLRDCDALECKAKAAALRTLVLAGHVVPAGRGGW